MYFKQFQTLAFRLLLGFCVTLSDFFFQLEILRLVTCLPDCPTDPRGNVVKRRGERDDGKMTSCHCEVNKIASSVNLL